MRMHSADYAVARCPSVRLSVTRWYSVETTNQTYPQTFFNCRVAKALKFFRTKPYEYDDIPTEPPSGGCRMQVGYENTAIFAKYLALARKWYETGNYYGM